MKINQVILEDIKRIVKNVKKEIVVLQGQTVLITGGSGFLGKYLLYTCFYINEHIFPKRNPCKVISVDNFITGTRNNSIVTNNPNFTFIRHDVRMPLKLQRRIDYVIHAAGIASPIYYSTYPLETIEVSTTGTKNLLELALKKKSKSFLFFSSSEIYGDADPHFLPTPETYSGNVSCIGPRSCYDESKRLGETLCIVYHRLYNSPVKIVRPFNIYGPGMKPNDYRVIPKFLTSAIRNQPLPVYAGGNQTRTFCYISDAITGFLKVLLSKNEGCVYNVGNDNNELNMLALATMVNKLFHNKATIKTVNYPHAYPQDDSKRRCPDLTKIRSQLGYIPHVQISEGLKRTLRWYEEQLHVRLG